MTRALTLADAQTAITLASRGSSAQIDRFEDAIGCSLSSALDALWDMAEEGGRPVLASRLERAYNRLTA